MIELSADGQLPLVGPFFRLSLRAQTDTAFGNKQFFTAVVTPGHGEDLDSASQKEQGNEFFVTWLTDWMDTEQSGWQIKAGLTRSAPASAMHVRMRLTRQQCASRYRGAHLMASENVFTGLPFYVRKDSPSEVAPEEIWYARLPENVLELVAKRYSDTLTKKEMLGSPGRLSLNEIVAWYKTSRPGGSQKDVAVLQRQVAILLEELMTIKEHSAARLEKLNDKELAQIRAVYLSNLTV